MPDLRPGKTEARGECALSSKHHRRYGVSLLREVISPLGVREIAGRSEVTLRPGSLISRCRIRRQTQAEVDSGADAYEVEFHADGRAYLCPLFRFQPRTRLVERVTLGAVAV